ncbi:MAG: signal recognition particle-docking protein FtsY [Alphaproteobacteria bacterium]|nr:signal recognition particle-docking protein FtsY [Alphaproteobacteria bacterium]
MFNRIGKKLTEIIQGKKIDSDTLESIEDSLILADIHPLDATELSKILSKLPVDSDVSVIKKTLFDTMIPTLKKGEKKISISAQKPSVIFVSGLNGAGKTTTLYKLASFFKKQKLSILVAGCDTFRAGAVQQLRDRMNLLLIETIGENRKDPASLAYKALERAINEQYDILLVDTAGRLHDNENLMAELQKIQKTLKKFGAQYPQESWLVIDGNSGQNTLSQLEKFTQRIELNGLIITKLDISEKAGFVYSLLKRFDLPILFQGHGEKENDLESFNAEDFLRNLLDIGESK